MRFRLSVTNRLAYYLNKTLVWSIYLKQLTLAKGSEEHTCEHHTSMLHRCHGRFGLLKVWYSNGFIIPMSAIWIPLYLIN